MAREGPVSFPDSGDTTISWTTGDIDGSGQDEIVAFRDRTILVYRWNGTKFALSRYAFPYLVDDAIIGDVNNDGHNELVVLGYDPKGYIYNLCVVRLQGRRAAIVFNDSGRFGFVKFTIVPPDWLVCIADLVGDGTNQLVAAEEQSDMGPTHYSILKWASGKLVLVHKGEFAGENRAVFPALFKDLIPVKLTGVPMLVATELGGISGVRHLLVRMKQDTYLAADTVFQDSGNVGPDEAFWLNIDGRGKGVLQVMMPTSGQAEYRFYRAEREP